MEHSNNIRTDKPSAEVRELFFGSIDKEKYLKRQWKGGFEPDIEWLKKPLERGYTKEFCSGCGSHSEVTREHVDRILEMSKTDPKATNWKEGYFELNACDFCIESLTGQFTVSIAFSSFKK